MFLKTQPPEESFFGAWTFSWLRQKDGVAGDSVSGRGEDHPPPPTASGPAINGAATLAAPGWTINQRLALLALAGVIPLMMLLSAIIWHLAGREREDSREAIVYSSRSIMSAVDAQLGKYKAVAQALATSSTLMKDNLVAFREETEHALPGLPGSWVALIDLQGHLLVITAAAPDAPLPQVSRDTMADAARAFETRQPQTSDVRIGVFAKIPLVLTIAPVFRDGRPAYILVVAAEISALQNLLNSQRVPSGWRCRVLDRRGTTVAGCHQPELSGQPALAAWQAIRTTDGVHELRSDDGETLIVANAVSPQSGWAIAVGVERRAFEAPFQQTMIIGGIVGLAVTLLSLLLALRIARAIATPIKVLAKSADAMRSHEAVSFAHTGVPEIDSALSAFDAASRQLRAHEERRDRAERMLKNREERLRLFIEQAPTPIALFDRNMRYLAVSRRWIARFCPENPDVLGRSHYEVLPETPESWRAVHRRALAGEVLTADDDPFVRSDGRTQWVSWEASPWLTADGTVGGVVLLADDVTSRHEAEDRRRTLNHASRAADIGGTAAALAHELNQPLAAVATYINGCRRILGSDLDVDGLKKKLREVMERANTQALRAGDVIRELRESIDSGPTERQIEDAASVLREAASLAINDTRHNGVSSRFDVDQTGDILVDKLQIQQVVGHLVRNAVEAMETTPRKDLLIRLSVDDKNAEFSVSDTGPGLSPDMTDRLFKPFSSTKRKGMGISLSISRGIVEAHGGMIWAEPKADGGTVFRFTLPLVQAETARQHCLES